MSQFSRRNVMTAGSGLTLAGLIGLVRPAWAQMGGTYNGDGYSFMASDPRLRTWTQLIDAGGLQGYARADIYTVFPAADTAFAQFPGMVRDLLGPYYSTGTHNAAEAFPDTSKIVKLVRSHAINGKHYPNEVMGKSVTVTSIAGTPIAIDGTDPNHVKVTWTSAANGQTMSALLVDQPVTCTNAVVYIVNTVEKM